MTTTVISSAIAAFLLCLAGLPLVKRLSGRYGVVAIPDKLSRHREPIPLLGGAAIVAAVLIIMAALHILPLWLFAGTAGLFAVGIIDDAVALRPFRKFLLQLAAVLAAVIIGPPHYAVAPWPFISEALAIFWLISTVNAFNLIDGLDGLAGGVGITAAISIGAIGMVRGDVTLAAHGAILAGALGAFLIFNRHPASIFMGDCGSLPLGFLLGTLSLHAGALSAASHLSQYSVPILIMLVPLLDMGIVSVSRMATGAPISRRGLDHSHHRLLALGLSDQRAVGLCWSIAVIACGSAVGLSALPHPYLVVLAPIVGVFFAVAGLFMVDLTFDSRPPGVAYGYAQGLARLILNFSYKRRLAEAVLDLLVISAAYFGAFLLRLNFEVNDRLVGSLVSSLPWVIGASYAAFAIAGIYRGIWRYAGFSDVARFAAGSVIAALLLDGVSQFVRIELSGSIIVLFALLLFNMLVASRLSFRALRKGIALLAPPGERVLIIGAGETAEAAARYLTSGRTQKLRMVGFADDDSFKVGKILHGYGVLGTLADLERIKSSVDFERIVLADESLPADRLALVRQFADSRHIPVRRFSINFNDLEVHNGASPLEILSDPEPGSAAAHGQMMA